MEGIVDPPAAHKVKTVIDPFEDGRACMSHSANELPSIAGRVVRADDHGKDAQSTEESYTAIHAFASR
ncbi:MULTISPECIES: hypothetical protein [unclassified Bradyrhizobium]|uniref:hypothetical protein n=1 Tax=unclassified Bradyrhizobium TaxID=2631580 RepID=UPI00247A5398|nr:MULTISPECIES: hypothetical protein [unclassified Bradyrhizobium]WGR72760.1 hypothetical protein MTX24_07570 [Bradyrhizobium sp. ISRA426]WGR77595.1 hypothetical protein MTX21_32525 [Bradyrhizobium sp. ISRA430]WGR88001.1 hypothetical protein MTX25_07575 [Bradyrhizobium sp. ISRA432]